MKILEGARPLMTVQQTPTGMLVYFTDPLDHEILVNAWTGTGLDGPQYPSAAVAVRVQQTPQGRTSNIVFEVRDLITLDLVFAPVNFEITALPRPGRWARLKARARRLITLVLALALGGCGGAAETTVLEQPDPIPLIDPCTCEADKAKAIFACFKTRERCVEEPQHHAYTPECFDPVCRHQVYTRAVECAEACGFKTREYACRAHCSWIMDQCLRGQAETGGPAPGRANACAEIEWGCYAERCPEVL